MRITPVRVVVVPGRVFSFDEFGLSVNDLYTNDVISIESGHALSLGQSATFNDSYEFCLMESGRVVALDDMDAAILEMSSVEIA
jgi:hypothetical protein